MYYYRRRGILSRVISLGVFVAILGVAGVKIRGALKQSQIVDRQARRIDQLAEGKLGSSFVIPANFGREIAGVRRLIGPHARMLQVELTPTGLEFQYVVGQRAAGLTANTVQPDLKPEEVTLDEPGSPVKRSFPLSIVRAGVPAAIIAAIRRTPGLSDFQLQGMSLALHSYDNRVEWSLAGTGGGHQLVYTASPDGRHLTRDG